MNYNVTICEITKQASSYNKDSKLLKLIPPPPRPILRPQKGFKFNIERYRKMFNYLLLKNYNALICDISVQASLNDVDFKLSKS